MRVMYRDFGEALNGDLEEMALSWDMLHYDLVDVYRRFEGIIGSFV
jgi:hypothetical protein